MITASMNEAKSRLSELVKAVEENGETVLICRDGTPVVQLAAWKPERRSRLKADPSLKVTISPSYDPIEPLQPDEIPEEYR